MLPPVAPCFGSASAGSSQSLFMFSVGVADMSFHKNFRGNLQDSYLPCDENSSVSVVWLNWFLLFRPWSNIWGGMRMCCRFTWEPNWKACSFSGNFCRHLCCLSVKSFLDCPELWTGLPVWTAMKGTSQISGGKECNKLTNPTAVQWNPSLTLLMSSSCSDWGWQGSCSIHFGELCYSSMVLPNLP